LADIDVKELLQAGVHFGHRVSRWNPKMLPYIFGKRHQIHIIDLRETIKGMIRGMTFLSDLAAKGGDVLFLGTKRQARTTILANAEQCRMHYVDERWLGGTLTNYDTIRSRLNRLQELERMQEDGTLRTYSKKAISRLMREKRRILRNLHGIRNMSKLPGVLIIVDPRREVIAVREANRLNIPVIGILDTDSDPDRIDIPIPANDDAMRSIQAILSKLTDAIMEGLAARTEGQAVPERPAAAPKAKETGEGSGASGAEAAEGKEAAATATATAPKPKSERRDEKDSKK